MKTKNLKNNSKINMKQDLKEFLETCQDGGLILKRFQQENAEKIRELTLAKAHCAATVLHLMQDERSKRAVQAAIDYGEGRISKEELRVADAYAAAVAALAAADAAVAADADAAAAVAADAAVVAAAVAVAAADADDAVAAAAVAAAAAAAIKTAEKAMADICRQYLPLRLWNKNYRYE